MVAAFGGDMNWSDSDVLHADSWRISSHSLHWLAGKMPQSQILEALPSSGEESGAGKAEARGREVSVLSLWRWWLPTEDFHMSRSCGLQQRGFSCPFWEPAGSTAAPRDTASVN